MAKLLLEFNQNVKRNMDVEEFKEELWDIMVAFGEPIEIGLEVGGRKCALQDGPYRRKEAKQRAQTLCRFKDSITLRKKFKN